PGWRHDKLTVKIPPPDVSGDPPAWASKQYARILARLEKLKAAGGQGEGQRGAGTGGAADRGREEGGDAGSGGTGAGGAGTGQGGGGTDTTGKGQGPSGKGKGAEIDKQGGGGAPERQVDRRLPDKVVLWTGKHGPMLNVWAGGQAEAIALRENEGDDKLEQRIEEAAARQVSTGKRLANGATTTGIQVPPGGQGTGKIDPALIEKGARTDANAPEYPSKISMLGGSGAEVSPKGWATTVTGAGHDFDMVLDWDAVEFGLANQVIARLGWITYRWQVIDVSKVPAEQQPPDQVENLSEDEQEKQRKKAEALRAKKALESGDVRTPSKMERMKEDVGRTAEHASEELKEDRPDFKLTDSPQ